MFESFAKVEAVLHDRAYDVCFSMPWAGPLLDGSGPTGGAETQMLAVARGLARAGLTVAVLVVGDSPGLPRESDGVHVLTHARAPAIRGAGGLVHDAGLLGSLLRARPRVVVHRNASRSVAVVALAARLMRARFVYSSGSLADFFDASGIDRAYNRRLYEWGMRAADQIVVQTDEQARLCRIRFGREPLVIRSIAARAEPRRATPEAFLWVGRMAPYKRLDVYLDLAAAMPEARFRLIAVPASDDQPEMTARLARAREELPNLEILDPVPPAELGALVDRAVAVVNTSEFEGMPNVFLEGWSRGVPALAFSHDPDSVVAAHGLGAFASGSPDRLLELAREQWASRLDQRGVAARCLQYVRRHHDVDAVCELWRETVAGRT
jgi:glycosyltransferase involved in cell wall biosynthesis